MERLHYVENVIEQLIDNIGVSRFCWALYRTNSTPDHPRKKSMRIEELLLKWVLLYHKTTTIKYASPTAYL